MTIKRIEYVIIILLVATLLITYVISHKENRWQTIVTERHMKQLALLENANANLKDAIRKLDTDRAADVREFQIQMRILEKANGVSKKNNAILKESCEIVKENNKILTLNKSNLQGIANQLDEHGEFIGDVDRTMLAVGEKMDANNRLLAVNAPILKEVIAKLFKPEPEPLTKEEVDRLSEAVGKGDTYW